MAVNLTSLYWYGIPYQDMENIASNFVLGIISGSVGCDGGQ